MSQSKVAVITGGSYGIGAAIAEKFGELGYSVAVVGRSEEALHATTNRLSHQGITARSWKCDVTQWVEVVETVESIKAELGPPSLLVNNAGGWIGTRIIDLNVLELRRLVDVCIAGTMHFTKAVLPIMQERRIGFILNIGSTSGLLGSHDSAIASAPKAAVRLFTHTVARELAGYGIRVGILHPARVNKKLAATEVEGVNAEGFYTNLSPRQVAEVAAFMVEQPPNVAIREVIMTPSDVFI